MTAGGVPRGTGRVTLGRDRVYRRTEALIDSTGDTPPVEIINRSVRRYSTPASAGPDPGRSPRRPVERGYSGTAVRSARPPNERGGPRRVPRPAAHPARDYRSLIRSRSVSPQLSQTLTRYGSLAYFVWPPTIRSCRSSIETECAVSRPQVGQFSANCPGLASIVSGVCSGWVNRSALFIMASGRCPGNRRSVPRSRLFPTSATRRDTSKRTRVRTEPTATRGR